MVKIVTTRWKPDTCDCVIEYEWDRDLDVSSRTHTGNNIVKDCPEHSGLGTPANFYNVITDENQRKNKVRQDILENVGDLAELQNGELVFKNGIALSWSWTGQDADRVLHITITGYTLTQQQKNALAAIADSKYGISKVVFD